MVYAMESAGRRNHDNNANLFLHTYSAGDFRGRVLGWFIMIYVIFGAFATLACLASFVAGGIAGLLFACACVTEELKRRNHDRNGRKAFR